MEQDALAIKGFQAVGWHFSLGTHFTTLRLHLTLHRGERQAQLLGQQFIARKEFLQPTGGQIEPRRCG